MDADIAPIPRILRDAAETPGLLIEREPARQVLNPKQHAIAIWIARRWHE
jgi:hypothetical protein